MSEILKLTPFFSERLWGCQRLKQFGFQIPNNKKIGEAWVISALENGMSYVLEGKYKGTSLKDLYEQHNAEIFKDGGDKFPLLSKIITAEDFLSVQVHPDDDYALSHEGCYGKPECWYVLDAPANSEIIYGHSAKSKSELTTMVNNHEWDKLFTKVPVRAGDFVYVPPGKVHAISPGVTVFELQRSSDITYRFYDFDRKDQAGNLRPLHIQQCLETTTVPDSQLPVVHLEEGILIDNEYFTLQLINCKTSQNITLPVINWCEITVIAGSGSIDNHQINSGDSLIMYNLSSQLSVQGTVKILLCYKK